MAELADALDLGSSGTPVQVQVLSPAPKKSYYFDTTFFIHYIVMAYHHAFSVQKNSVMMIYNACALMIFSHFVPDDIHFLRK